ncbi:transglycosylase domain-containing protein, partial [Actinophytocola xinjiangensis]|uniref:transglycosylase domain-containing protein n=1 Tax=Actinophytocola xinjiangensis TaxID=485602 RepID=UPI000AE6D322
CGADAEGTEIYSLPVRGVVRPRPGGQPAGPARPGGAPAPGSAGVNMDGPTEMMPQVHKRRTGPEPELLTHREPGYDDPVDDYRDDYRDDDYDDEEVPLSQDQKRLRRKRIWRRVRRTGYVLTALMIILPLIGFFVAYQLVDVPSPQTIAKDQAQVAKLTYSNDKLITEMLPPDGQNRRMVRYEELPEQVKNAVFAAEDAEFMTNPGFDIAGVMRAAWNQLSGGQGGGSTITQQYIKKATGNEEKSITRKALEVVQAYKMNNTYSKEDIITAYLNTIYFGRGAYGIAAAAKAYYDKELKDITPSEAALLAGMIQSPSRFDEPEYMTRRWEFVLGQMVNNGWFPAEQAKTEKFPQPEDWEKLRTKALTDYRAHIQRRVMDELARDAGITEQDIFQQGLVIKTTIDPAAQKAAVESVKNVMDDESKNILPALVAVKPGSGEIVAYYGGNNGIGTDWAAAEQEPGSSFKPFDLVALLQKGMGLGEDYDGTSGRTFEGREAPVRNAGGDDSCGKECTVAKAMEKSVNTVFYEIAVEIVGTKAVRDAARQAGITSDLNGDKPEDAAPDGNISIGGGDTRVSTMEMASAYATFAAGGIYNKPHLVSEVRYPDGTVKWTPTQTTKNAFDKNDPDNNAKIARNVTESLMPVLEHSDLECDGDWECAGKTGTHQFGNTDDNAKAWMVGYSREISAAVSMGAEKDKKQIPLINSDGDIVYGSGLPGEIWLDFMNRYHKNKEPKDFPEFEAIGKTVEEFEAENRRTEETRNEDGNNGRGNDDDEDGRPGGGGGGNGPKPTGGPTIPTGEPSIPTGEPSIPTDPENPGNTFTPPFPGPGDVTG